MNSIKILDTTLRDGEQMSNVVFSEKQKLNLAKKSSEFGCDYIDLMPIISENEKNIAKKLIKEDFGSKMIASCRTKKADIEVALDCGFERVTIFTSISDIHINSKLKITPEKNMTNALEAISYAKEHGLIIDFAGEDSSRANIDYLTYFIQNLEPHIDTFYIADTLGCFTPNSCYNLVKALKENYKCKFGLHNHNDYGLATANTLAGLSAGADVFSGTFTGIGERSGNVPIEEVCVGLYFLYDIKLDLQYSQIKDICNLVEKYSGIEIHQNKPIIGYNSFSHESGMHLQGILENPRTYENFEPEFVGQKRTVTYGKHSGKSNLRYLLNEVSEEELSVILKKIKSESESKMCSFSEKEIFQILGG